MEEDPLPPPHPELTKYLNPPEEVVKRSAKALEKLKAVLDVKIGTLLLTIYNFL